MLTVDHDCQHHGETEFVSRVAATTGASDAGRSASFGQARQKVKAILVDEAAGAA